MITVKRGVMSAAVLAACVLSVGCSRKQMNSQIAECIGTTGKYENGEPVETPKMKNEREQRESQEAADAAFAKQLDKGQVLADSYDYEAAIAYAQGLKVDEQYQDDIRKAVSGWQSELDSMISYEGDIPHLCFPGLVEDTMRAFDGDDMSSVYTSSMVTTKEFKAILQSLYDANYILIRISDIAADESDDRGVSTLEMKELKLPADKKPIIISQDNLNYTNIREGDGVATALTLDENGTVKAVYQDADGHRRSGDYDLIPILNSFVAEHPDFSYRGARGIVSVSGSEGVFGYSVTSTALSDTTSNQDTVTQIADALKKEGWDIACAGYAHTYMNEMSQESLEADIGKWLSDVAPLVGDTNILFYPYGGEVKYPSDQLTYLTKQGMEYLCGLWGDQDYKELGDGYMRMTRRFVDGYTLENAPQYFTTFFDVKEILDSDR